MNTLINFVIVRVSIVIFCLILGFFAWESTIYAEDFVRSGCNGDGQVDLADAAYIHHFSTTGELGIMARPPLSMEILQVVVVLTGDDPKTSGWSVALTVDGPG